MKFNLMTLVITTLLIGSIFSQDCLMVWKTDLNDKCEKVNTSFKIGESKQKYPGDLKIDKDYDEANKNALAQTKAARNLLYKPKKEVIDLVKSVAVGLDKLFKIKETLPDLLKFILESKDQRQTSDTGTMQAYFKSATDLVKGSDKVNKAATIKSVMANFVSNGQPSGVDILAFLGFLGDLGTCIQDTFWRKLEKCDKQDTDKKGVATAFSTNVSNLDKDKAVAKDFYTRLSPDNFYNIEGKQNKKTERMNCEYVGTDKSPQNFRTTPLRGGVMDSGDGADDALLKDKKIEKDKVPLLPKIGWPWQTIPEKLTNFCKKEPWAGHFSGSVHEQILMLHILSNAPDDKNMFDASKEVDPAKKRIIAALSSAFLISIGMHSAIEVMVPVNNYLNGASDKIDIDNDKGLAAKICGDTDVNAPTKWFVKLAGEWTQTAKKRRLK